MSRQLKDWDEIKADYERMQNMPYKPEGKKYPVNYIFDEEKSVKWNRQEVERRNQEREDLEKELQQAKNKASNEVHEDIYYAIQNEVDNANISREAAAGIWEYAYQQGHACGWNDIKICLDEVLELISKILNSKF